MQERNDRSGGSRRRTLVVGDIHGRRFKLIEALHRAGYEAPSDRLIFLGDYVDRGPESREVVELVMALQEDEASEVYCLKGNHDVWLVEDPHMLKSFADRATVESYGGPVPQDQVQWLDELPAYLELEVDGQRCLFVHAGYQPGVPIERQSVELLTWDRYLWYSNADLVKTEDRYDRVFVGHTSVDIVTTQGRVTNVDTGAGYVGGCVSVHCVESGETWRSTTVLPESLSRTLARSG